MADFIGRGEELAKWIVGRLFQFVMTSSQVPICTLLKKEDAEIYGEEFSNHKVDIVSSVLTHDEKRQQLAIEVNYRHKEKAAKKWNHNFEPDLKKAGVIPVTINDYDCRSDIPGQKGLFTKDSNGNHKLTWNDFRDVIDQLEKAGVKP